MATSIRPLLPHEIKAYKALRLQALHSDPDAFGETLEQAQTLTDEEWSERLAKALSTGAVIFVAQDDEQINDEVDKENKASFVGMCAVGEDQTEPGYGFIRGMFVVPSARKGGVGTSLMQAAEAWAYQRGLHGINARVAAPNESAIRFYRKLGYAIGPVTGTLRLDSSVQVYSIAKRFVSLPPRAL